MRSLFYDSYALIEIVEGNPNYKKYVKNIKIATTKLNLMEVYYYFVRHNLRKEAEEYFKKLLPFTVPIADAVLKKAMYFKLKHKHLSYVDCIGYILATTEGIRFLTGDKEFKEMGNVEFVK